MRYSHDMQRSAEYVRLALPLMAKQAAAMHPLSFSLWYEHVAGMNAALSADLERALQAGTPLTEEAVQALYRRHIAGVDEQSAQQFTDGLQRILSQVSESAGAASDEASRFGLALTQWSSEQHDDADFLLENTRQMQQAIVVLGERLEQSQQEIEQLKREVEQAREDALCDALTGLANRRRFDAALDACLAGDAAETGPPSLLMVDIDHFKSINDRYGHLFGDKVLRAMAQILKDNIKGKDLAARYGGEEFAILLPDTPLDGAHALAEHIRHRIAACRILRGSNEPIGAVSVSLGLARYQHGESSTEFLARADGALYTSKTQGRNRVTVAA